MEVAGKLYQGTLSSPNLINDEFVVQIDLQTQTGLKKENWKFREMGD